LTYPRELVIISRSFIQELEESDGQPLMLISGHSAKSLLEERNRRARLPFLAKTEELRHRGEVAVPKWIASKKFSL
jgi:hypothetical protein